MSGSYKTLSVIRTGCTSVYVQHLIWNTSGGPGKIVKWDRNLPHKCEDLSLNSRDHR